MLPALTLALVAFPTGWAYWLVEPVSKAIRRRRADSSAIAPKVGVVFVGVVALVLAVGTLASAAAWIWLALAIAAALTLAVHARSKHVARANDPVSAPPASRGEEVDHELKRNNAQRSLLGKWLSRALVASAAVLAFATIDSLGQTAYAHIADRSLGAWLGGVLAGAGTLAGFARQIAVSRTRGPNGSRPSGSLVWIATVAALLLVTLALTTLDVVAHAVSYRRHRPADMPSELWQHEGEAEPSPEPPTGTTVPRDAWVPGIGALGCFVLSILFGQTWPFLTRSSHHPLYAGRLTRAYLGASNRKRWQEGASVTDPMKDDDVDLARYWPPPRGPAAPLHLINVTVNETISGRSQVEQRDRRGIGMALGPCGLSAGVQHHAVVALGSDSWIDPVGAPVEVFPRLDAEASERPFRMFEFPPDARAPRFTGEVLPLGDWIAISGAAFSTGIGSRTSLGLSLLAGMANVRLGRWWDSGIDPARRLGANQRHLDLRLEDRLARLLPTQVYLLDELLARFHGPARRHWYLSDGGHFENLGGYELLRRALPVIVIVDAEADPSYTFSGLANLVLKARVDFDAEIEFPSGDELTAMVTMEGAKVLGSLADLVPDPRSGVSERHAALARVRYTLPEQREGRLIYVKATLDGQEPADLAYYRHSHETFPQQTTADQFFDEAQWESYRKLGEHIAGELFGPPVPGSSPEWWRRLLEWPPRSPAARPATGDAREQS